MSSNIVAHNPKFAAQFQTREQIAALPMPVSMGKYHQPIHHNALIGTILDVADRRGHKLIREKYAVGSEGHSLFAVLDFEGLNSDRAMSLGFRSSTNQSLALQGVAGSHVFVCDNLALSGDFVTWARKSTVNLDLYGLVNNGFDMFSQQTQILDGAIKQLEAATISDDDAKRQMWDIFADDILPHRLLGPASINYFKPEETWTDCTPRTRWGVYNALTRAARVLAPMTLAEVTPRLGKVFGL